MQRFPGGKREFSIRFIQGRFKTQMATESAICPESPRRLLYLRDLGVDAIWLSPIFPSPMADFGYDISNYLGVDAIFGTLDDFDTLVAAAHASHLKVILDLVPNHTSDQHPWFIESRSSRDNQKRDWYLWREPRADGLPANNWMSEFGGSAWSYDAGTKAILLSRLPRPAARSELAQSGGPSSDLRCYAFLVSERRRWLSRRCTLAFDQGCGISRQPAQSKFSPGPPTP